MIFVDAADHLSVSDHIKRAVTDTDPLAVFVGNEKGDGRCPHVGDFRMFLLVLSDGIVSLQKETLQRGTDILPLDDEFPKVLRHQFAGDLSTFISAHPVCEDGQNANGAKLFDGHGILLILPSTLVLMHTYCNFHC